METLKFSYDWNKKLQTNYYTTIRLSPRFEVGEVVGVMCGKKRMNNAQCRAKKKILLKDIDVFTATLDTGYDLDTTKKILEQMYPGKDWHTQPIYLYLFMRLGFEKMPSLFSQF